VTMTDVSIRSSAALTITSGEACITIHCFKFL
jgi:hypothetical protein